MAYLLLDRGRRRLVGAMAGVMLVILSGCTSLFFYPDNRQYVTPDQLRLAFEEVQLSTSDDEQLYGWWLPAEGQPQGTVYFLHGNAQNISAHFLNVSWLPGAGYNVFIIDYRGFGMSTGSPDLEGVLIDSMAGLDWALDRSDPLPVFVLGQSLGGAMALLASHEANRKPEGLIIDGAFAGFRRIAQEKLNQSWITWALQVPLSWLIPANREPLSIVGKLDLPLLFIHSNVDNVVPAHHGRLLYAAASPPKQFLATETPHAATFAVDEYRQTVLDFLLQHRNSAADRQIAHSQSAAESGVSDEKSERHAR
ncbi:alpha/beta hydrolase [Hydrocarboniclastica marina]|uniref:Alpha/beta fold hydrolase n=1 Tax=Hydrocarboniclastica marina TaxID=2259620 RepID=A0A4P7XII9_9ALTE|nr:alpha/beta fold hydrolase [Hydrocarboniclastica marina]QCF26899.1 alpha/beta fold hydrolase [Hydrocarboniclastica marina]